MKKQGKKILIGVLIAILIGGLIFVFILNFYNQSNSINQSNITSIISEEEKTDNENMLLDNEVREENIKSVNQDNMSEEQNNKEEQIVVNTKTTTNNNASNSDNKTSVKKDNNTEKKDTETLKNNEKNNQTPKVEEVTEEKSEPNISHVPKEEPEKEEINNKEDHGDERDTNQEKTEDKPIEKEEPKEEIKQEEVYSYKYNATMTEQIRQDIINNESEYMKKNGYTIKIDESIVDLTNQFTYTAERVKSKIVKKFGTIRIYARDFYYNGSYIFTECYII